ncbi:hypothetical protein GQ457_07G011320 [Hibiscus cannabinus]
MSIISWNVKGLGNKEIVRALKNDAFKFKPCIIFLSLALWWSKDVKVSILSHRKNFTGTKISSNEDELFLTLIYGPPYVEEKQDFWESISSLRSNNSEKWCLIGATNIVASSEKKLGGLPFNVVQDKWTNKVKEEDMKEQIKILQGKQLSKNEMEELGNLKKKLDKRWESEERYWHQRARIEWLKVGDQNKNSFHSTTIQNRQSNAICRIKDQNGEWVENESDIAFLFQNHFMKVYAKDAEVDFESLLEIFPVVILPEMNQRLCQNVTEE